jgi:hypothetical protein
LITNGSEQLYFPTCDAPEQDGVGSASCSPLSAWSLLGPGCAESDSTSFSDAESALHKLPRSWLVSRATVEQVPATVSAASALQVLASRVGAGGPAKELVAKRLPS